MKNNQLEKFHHLHFNDNPLLLINIWDAASAAIAEQNGASAIATSSASLAWACGYADGNQLPITELLHAIKSIMRVIKLPLTVDIESGYSDSPAEVAQLVAQLVELGVVGINIEDGCQPIQLLNEKIMAINTLIGKDQIFINARTDVYLQSLVKQSQCFKETVARANEYLKSGANGIFIPGLTDPAVFTQLCQSIKAPINMMISSGNFDLAASLNAGVKRISLGPNPFLSAYNSLLAQSRELYSNKNSDQLSFDSMNDLF